MRPSGGGESRLRTSAKTAGGVFREKGVRLASDGVQWRVRVGNVAPIRVQANEGGMLHLARLLQQTFAGRRARIDLLDLGCRRQHRTTSKRDRILLPNTCRGFAEHHSAPWSDKGGSQHGVIR